MSDTPRRHARPAAAVAALAVPVLLLAACGSSDSGSSSSSAASSAASSASGSASSSASASATASGSASASDTAAAPTPAAKGDLAGITVGGTAEKPTVKIEKTPYTVKETTVKVLEEGSGDVIASGTKTTNQVLAVTGSNGATVLSNYGTGRPESWVVGNPQMLAGISKALMGQKLGSRLLVAMPPADAFGAQGQPQLKIGADETIVMLVDVADPPKPLKEATGAAVAPKAGFPTATFEYGKPATITVPKTKAPTTTQSEVLVQGTGATVESGQTIQVHYTGVTWADGKMFDSNFKNGGTDPFETVIGAGQVIPGWDKTLVGQKVGSRLLLVIPPTDGYGDQAAGEIPANSTLVFLVDILGAY